MTTKQIQKIQIPSLGLRVAVLSLLVAGVFTAQAQIVTNYLDDFAGPTLDGWTTNGGPGINHVGFTTVGADQVYQTTIETTGIEGGLSRPLSGTNSFTADVSVIFNSLTSSSFDFKYRFQTTGGGFIEVVYNKGADQLRIFSGELAQNIVQLGGIGYTAGDKLNLRLTRDVTTGTVKVGYSLGSNPLQVLATVSGLTQFNPTRVGIVFYEISGSGFFNPVFLIDRYEQRDGVFPISIPSFTDDFNGPALDASWNKLQSQPADHVGFTGSGHYEVRKTTTTGEAGLSRNFGGQGSFSSSVKFQLQDFVGSASQVEFRNPANGTGGLSVKLISTGDIIVNDLSTATTIATLAGFNYQNGESLEFLVSGNAISGAVQVGLRRNGGPTLRLANLTGVTTFNPTNNQIVVIKNAVGNGNSPRLLVDHYTVEEGFSSVDVVSFMDSFSGPALDSSWKSSDSGTGSHLGFNGAGQYSISPQTTNVTAGLKRFLGMASDVTIDLRGRLNNFTGSDSELRLQVPGSGGLSVLLKSTGTLEVYSAELASTILSTASGVSNGDLLDLRVTIRRSLPTLAGKFEVGLGINGGPLNFLTDAINLLNLDPIETEVVIARNGVGNTPVLVLDRFAVTEGFSAIPEVVDTLFENFDGLDASWSPSGFTHVGPNGLGQYEILVVTNADVKLDRLLSSTAPPGIPVGSFTAKLDVKFLNFANTNSETDFKLLFPGNNFVEVVFNSFKNMRTFANNNGGNITPPGNFTLNSFQDGDTLNIIFIYDASEGRVSVTGGLNGGAPLYAASKSGLLGFTPQFMEIKMFRFGFNNLSVTGDILLDRFEITPGTGTVPGALTILPAYGGRVQIDYANGVLQSAPAVTGPWSDVPLATSPYLQLPNGSQSFFRTRN